MTTIQYAVSLLGSFFMGAGLIAWRCFPVIDRLREHNLQLRRERNRAIDAELAIKARVARARHRARRGAPVD